MQKNSLSGSIINELEVAESDWQDRLNALKKLKEIKSRIVEKVVIIREEKTIKTYNYVRKNRLQNH